MGCGQLRKLRIQMQLTKQTDFAFRVLLYVGQLPEEELATIREICDFYDISQNHVAKVVVKLTRLGYLQSIRGKKGGIRLAQPADQINLASVVEHFESTMQPVNCMAPRCTIVASCRLKGVLHEAMTAFTQTLAAKTLADLLDESPVR